MNPTILLFNVSDERARLIEAAAARFHAAVLTVPKSSFREPLEALLIGQSAQTAQSPLFMPFTDEMLLLAGVPEALLTPLLQAVNAATPQRIALKAVLTDYNRQWDAMTLHAELLKEHNAMRGRG